MGKELKLDRAKILSQLEGSQSTSDGWVLEYDADVDQLFYGAKKIPKGYFLFQLNDELSLFVNKNSRVGGMFVEYFHDNYLEHNQELKPVLPEMKDDDSTVEIEGIERVALGKELFLNALTAVVKRERLVTAVD